MDLKDKRDELLRKLKNLKKAISLTDNYEEIADLRAKEKQVHDEYLFIKGFMETSRKVGE